MNAKLFNLSKKISQVIGLALTTVAISKTEAANLNTNIEENGNIENYVSNASVRKTIPVLKLSINNANSSKFVANHGSHRSHGSHSSHSSHRSSSFVY